MLTVSDGLMGLSIGKLFAFLRKKQFYLNVKIHTLSKVFMSLLEEHIGQKLGFWMNFTMINE